MNAITLMDSKILIIDDEKDLRDLLEAFLRKEGFGGILQAADGASGVKACREHKPDIVLLDVMLPDMDGFEVCRRVREFTYTPVIFLSAREEEVDKLLGLGIGGDDYVTKPFSLKEVAYRIKAQLRRRQYMTAPDNRNDGRMREPSTDIDIGNPYNAGSAKGLYSFQQITINTYRSEVKKDGKPVELTAKEYQLLVCFAENQGRILSKSTLYEAVWGEDYIGDDNTIMVHIRHLREKLENDPGNPGLIVTVKGLGYKLAAKDGAG